VKFLRQLAAAAATAGVVVLIGIAWDSLRPSLPGEGPGDRALVVNGHLVKGLLSVRNVPARFKLPAGTKLVPGLHLDNAGGIPGLQLGDLLKGADLVVLRNTALIEAAVIAAVVIIDASLRKRRRARRLAQ
jgi:hypothetical protein